MDRERGAAGRPLFRATETDPMDHAAEEKDPAAVGGSRRESGDQRRTGGLGGEGVVPVPGIGPM